MLNWQEPKPDGFGYQVCACESPAGLIEIKWQNLADKDLERYTCVLPWGKTVDENSLEYAQIRVAEEFAILRDAIMLPPIMRHKFRWKLQAACREALKDYDKEVIHWADFKAPDCGGSPMEAMDEALGDAEYKLFEAVVGAVEKEYGVKFG